MNTQFLEMIAGRSTHVFDAADGRAAAPAERTPKTIREDLFSTLTQRINKTEQSLRREIVVHGTVFMVTSTRSPLRCSS